MTKEISVKLDDETASNLDGDESVDPDELANQLIKSYFSISEEVERVGSEDRKRWKAMKHLVRAVADTHEDGAPVEEVVRRARLDYGMDEEETLGVVESLRRRGEVYNPADGRLLVT